MGSGHRHVRVVVADAARARIHALRWEEGADGRAVPRLHETQVLTNLGRRAQDSELFTDSRPGIRQGTRGGARHGVDDHRQQHLDEMDRQFAADIVDRLADEVHGDGAPASSTVILVASHHLLGHLRAAADRLAKAGADVIDVAKDLTNLSPTALHDHLARDGLVPGRVRAPITRPGA